MFYAERKIAVARRPLVQMTSSWHQWIEEKVLFPTKKSPKARLAFLRPLSLVRVLELVGGISSRPLVTKIIFKHVWILQKVLYHLYVLTFDFGGLFQGQNGLDRLSILDFIK